MVSSLSHQMKNSAEIDPQSFCHAFRDSFRVCLTPDWFGYGKWLWCFSGSVVDVVLEKSFCGVGILYSRQIKANHQLQTARKQQLSFQAQNLHTSQPVHFFQ